MVVTPIIAVMKTEMKKKWKRIPIYYHLYIDGISSRNDLTNHHFDQYVYKQKYAALISLLVSD